MQLRTFYYVLDTYGAIFFLSFCMCRMHCFHHRLLLLLLVFCRRWSRRTLFFIVCNVFTVIINKVHSRVQNKEMQRFQMKHGNIMENKIFPLFSEHFFYTFYGQRLIIQCAFFCLNFTVLDSMIPVHTEV